MTLIELRQRTEAWFGQLGIRSARLDAELLIGEALGIQRLVFITDGQRPLTDEEVESCRELLRRRGKREPVAYILGTREFYSRDFAVDRRVLIPRPDTEHLVDLALQWLRRGRIRGDVVAELDEPRFDDDDDAPPLAAPLPGVETTIEYEPDTPSPSRDDDGEGSQAPASPPELSDPAPVAAPTAPEPPRDEPADAGVVLDYGTGSGAIAVTLAAEIPGLRVLAVDISRDALEVARANAQTHCVSDRVGFVASDGLTRVPPRFRGALRAIVANPPYVPVATRPELDPDVRDWEPGEALFAGEDPLLHYRALAREGRQWLAPGGFLALEVGVGQADEVAGMLRAAGWRDVQVQRDLGGIQRVVGAWRD
jgi:release factor glutamine methyltransferase